MVRTRLAPSPTGYMHIGTLRTALYSYLFAKQQGGQFILRIEDTDQERFVEGALEAIYEGLGWAGLTYDEGPDVGGNFGPYIQSERLPIYHQYIEELIEKNGAYYCFCSSEDLQKMREEQTALKKPPMYDRRCRTLDPMEAKEKAKTCTHVVRLKAPLDGDIIFTDMVRGHMRVQASTIDDCVLLKSDGFPTYHFAVVVDDHLMEITHVTRTEEWLPSAPKHVLLYQAFGWDMPAFAHLPLLLNQDRTKLSKRKGDVALMDFVKKGYLKAALINFIALLGWNPGDDREIFTLEELTEIFRMERVHKAGAVVDIEKLNWINSMYIRALTPEALTQELLSFWKERGAVTFTADTVTFVESGKSVLLSYFTSVATELQTRLVRLDEFMELTPFFFHPPLPYTLELLCSPKMKVTEELLREILPLLRAELDALSPDTWNRDGLSAHMSQWITDRGLKNGQVLWPLRALLTGSERSPGAYEMAAILGKEETLARIDHALSLLSL